MFNKNLKQAMMVCALAALVASTSAHAQQATGLSNQNNVETELNMGQDISQENQLGQPYAKEVNGDWELRCLRTEVPENDPCQMYQLMDDGEGVPVAEFSLFRLPGTGQAKAGATVIVPLETSLQDQLTIRVDEGLAKRYPFLFCNSLGCYARIGLTDEDIEAYKRGSEAEIQIVPARATDQRVVLKLSLSGFTASFDKTSVIDQ